MGMPKKQQPKPKSLAEQKKELLAKNYGQKQSKEVKNLLKKMEIQERLMKKQREEKMKQDDSAMRIVSNKKKEVQQKSEVQQAPEPLIPTNMVCRYLIDALQNKTYSQNWKCPMYQCKDIHEIDENYNLEEFLELKRVAVANDKLITKSDYDEIVKRLEKEKKKFEENRGLTGYDLYKAGMLKDAEETLE